MSKKYMEYEDLVYYDKKIKEYIDNFSGDAECDVYIQDDELTTNGITSIKLTSTLVDSIY